MAAEARRLGRTAGLLALILVGGGGTAAAQCAMCGLGAEQAADPETVSRTFGLAVLVLLVPVNLLVAGVVWLTWRARHWDGALLDPPPLPPGQSR